MSSPRPTANEHPLLASKALAALFETTHAAFSMLAALIVVAPTIGYLLLRSSLMAAGQGAMLAIFVGAGGAYIVATVVSVAGSIVFALLLLHGRRVVRAQRAMNEQVGDAMARPFVLYLRPFKSEPENRVPNHLRRVERFMFGERIAIELALSTYVFPDWRLVASGERSRGIGAAKRPGENPHWKEEIADLASRADLIVMAPASTPSTAWELTQIAANEAWREKTLLIQPPGSRDAWESARAVARNAGLVLPAHEEAGAIFRLGSDGRSHIMSIGRFDRATLRAAFSDVSGETLSSVAAEDSIVGSAQNASTVLARGRNLVESVGVRRFALLSAGACLAVCAAGGFFLGVVAPRMAAEESARDAAAIRQRAREGEIVRACAGDLGPIGRSIDVERARQFCLCVEELDPEARSAFMQEARALANPLDISTLNHRCQTELWRAREP